MRGEAVVLGLLLACAVQAGNNEATNEPDIGPAWTSPTETRSHFPPREGRIKKFRDWGEDMMKVVKRIISICARANTPLRTMELAMARYCKGLGFDLVRASGLAVPWRE